MATGTPRNKTVLKKGFGLMDWVKLTTAAKDLAGVGRLGGLRGYRLEEIREHRTEHDCWAVFMGKVYNITPYLHYHPGGADILVKAGGRDCTKLFNKYHPWVNLEGLAGKLVIGYLIEEEGDGEEGAAAGADGGGEEEEDSAPTSGGSSTATVSSSASNSTGGSGGGGGRTNLPMNPPPPPPLPIRRPAVEELMGKEDEEEEGMDTT